MDEVVGFLVLPTLCPSCLTHPSTSHLLQTAYWLPALSTHPLESISTIHC